MKKLLIAASLIMIAFVSNAQTSKGTWLLGGDAGFQSVKVDGGGSTSTWNLAPSMGYFLADNIAVRLHVDVSDNGAGTESYFGPALRYYFTSIGSNAKLFGDAGATFGDNYMMIGAKAGAAFFLNNSIALETALAYGNETKSKTTSIGLNVGFQIHLGK